MSFCISVNKTVFYLTSDVENLLLEYCNLNPWNGASNAENLESKASERRTLKYGEQCVFYVF